MSLQREKPQAPLTKPEDASSLQNLKISLKLKSSNPKRLYFLRCE